MSSQQLEVANAAPVPDCGTDNLPDSRAPRPVLQPLAGRCAPPLEQARAEAWAVVHCAERLGFRDISEALHQAIENVAEADESAEDAVRDLDAARDHALARLDACGALGGDSEAL